MTTNRFTPSSIGNYRFSIPLYQRLFEWEEKQIVQLLNDLHESFKKNDKQPYYIGMLTAFEKNNCYSLVDGQQRFTVLTLMAIAFEPSDWNSFIKTDDGKLRLNFFGRKNDEVYLEKRATGKLSNEDYKNAKMEAAIAIIEAFLKSVKDASGFVHYIYHQATFFISELPATYTPHDLNRYFESMNATGRGLENHEILKVNLLKKLTNNKEFYTRVWNAASQMDKCRLRPKEQESSEAFKQRQQQAISTRLDAQALFNLCNTQETATGNLAFKPIKEIEPSSTPPQKKYDTRNERAVLSFAEFLLQVLWLHLNGEQRKQRIDFFNTQKLQETFSHFDTSLNVEQFMQALLRYRLLFDYYVVRINHSDQNEVSYFLNFADEGNPETNKQLLQYQSMLHVSYVSHNWLPGLLKFVATLNVVTAGELLNELKTQDNERCKKETYGFSYESIDRYWFWRLDYYLWEKRNEYFKDRSLEIANKYVFKSNRSIEHVAPQTPKSNSSVHIPEEALNSFGNLAMISSGQNSSLQNESFEVKRAHVESYITGSKNGSIESLKMLKIYAYPEWNSKNIQCHSNEMLALLSDSFPVEFSDIAEKINCQRKDIEQSNTSG